jgi:hypothetical protein
MLLCYSLVVVLRFSCLVVILTCLVFLYCVVCGYLVLCCLVLSSCVSCLVSCFVLSRLVVKLSCLVVILSCLAALWLFCVVLVSVLCKTKHSKRKKSESDQWDVVFTELKSKKVGVVVFIVPKIQPKWVSLLSNLCSISGIISIIWLICDSIFNFLSVHFFSFYLFMTTCPPCLPKKSSSSMIVDHSFFFSLSNKLICVFDLFILPENYDHF